MTNPTPHGQVPQALIDLIDAYAETRHRYGRIYNAKTEAARNAVIEALRGVQALSAAPGEPPGIRALMCVISSLRDTAHFSDEEGELTNDLRTLRDWAYAQTAAFQPSPTAQGATIASESGTPPVEQLATTTEGCMQPMPDKCDQDTWRGPYYHLPLSEQAAPKAAPGVGNSGFDHQTAADFLSGKTVNDEAVRKFVAASRWAHDEKASLSAMLLSVRGVLASREAEIALLKKALLEAEAAPKQEAQEPCGWTTGITWRPDTRLQSEQVIKITRDTQPKYGYTTPIYAAPQPAPAPLSEREAFEAWIEKDGGDLGTFGTPPNMHYRNSSVNNAWVAWKARAALAAQGGKDA